MLDHLLDSLIPYGRRQRRLLNTGESLQATIVGIRRRGGSGDNSGDRWEFALDVAAPDGVRRVGVRQKGIDPSGSARLGTTVPVRTDGARTIIDLGPNLVYGDWKTLKTPPEPGVRDDLINVSSGEPTQVEVLAFENSRFLGVTTSSFDIAVRAPDLSQDVLERQIVPAYARHLLTEGRFVPAMVHRGKVTLDWARAANDDAQT